jgi:putative transposase
MNKYRDAIASGEYYHIYCRGNNKERIFFTGKDYYRLLGTLLLFQSSLTIKNAVRITDIFYKKGFSAVDHDLIDAVVNGRNVELVAFALMPNHFHLLVCQLKEGGVSSYMQRSMTSYTKYINARYNRTGHVFQGNFGRVLIKDNNQLLYVSTYIHQNSRELQKWKNKTHKYPWSSYQDYIGENRWGNLLTPQVITEQFLSVDKFKDFTESSVAKAEDFFIR